MFKNVKVNVKKILQAFSYALDDLCNLLLNQFQQIRNLTSRRRVSKYISVHLIAPLCSGIHPVTSEAALAYAAG